MAEDFYNTYQLDKDEIITSVYNKPNANVYLASFSRFAGNTCNTLCSKDYKRRIWKFTDIHIACFSNCEQVPIHFVEVWGNFHEILEEVLVERKLN